ncbi:MAG TPA: hypothetical protein VGE74_23300, partial [Gemmata sp.]
MSELCAARPGCPPRLVLVGIAALACALVAPLAPFSLQPAPKPPAPRPAGSDWPMAAKDFANTRYSELDQVSTENARNLTLAWKFDTGVHRGQEAAPIVVGDTMFVVTPWPNVLYAFDLTKPGPAVKWK